jgi:hypothetical protein
MQKNGEGRMEYKDLYQPENVMLLAKLTDKAIGLIINKKSNPSPDEIDLIRKGLFKKQNEVLNG